MNELNELKKDTLAYILIQNNLTKEEKIQLGEYVVKSNENQLLYLLKNGNIMTEAASVTYVGGLDGLTLVKAGKVLGVSIGVKAQAIIASLGALALTVVVAAALKRIYVDYIDKHGKKCRDYGRGKAHELCIKTVKNQAITQQINKAKEYQKYCSKNKNPVKCRSKIDEKIKKLKRKYMKNEIRIKTLDREIKHTREG